MFAGTGAVFSCSGVWQQDGLDSCFRFFVVAPLVFFQILLGPPCASQPRRVGAVCSDPPDDHPHLTLIHHSLTGTEKRSTQKRRVQSTSRSNALYSRSVVFSGFHLPALAICHLASAHKTIICASERFSLSLDVLTFFLLSCIHLRTVWTSKIHRRVQEKTHTCTHECSDPRDSVLPPIRNVCSPWVDFACSKLLAR